MATSKQIELTAEDLSAIQSLANETHLPVGEVNRIYAETLERLNSGARIKDYLILLASKTVRDELRHKPRRT